MEKISYPKKHWKDKLDPLSYKVTREGATERAFSSPLNAEKAAGVYHCACCDLALFDANAKYDSGSGWPSFFQAVADDHITLRKDRKLFVVRTEALCSRCDAHLGHVFEDGPQPTGLRYCMNGAALSFKQALPPVT